MSDDSDAWETDLEDDSSITTQGAHEDAEVDIFLEMRGRSGNRNCIACNGFTLVGREQMPVYYHSRPYVRYVKLLDVVQQAAAGCPYCRLLTEIWNDGLPAQPGIQDNLAATAPAPMIGIIVAEGEPIRLQLERRPSGYSPEDEEWVKIFNPSATTLSGFETLGARHGTWAARLEDDNCIRFIQEQLEVCERDHPACRVRVSAPVPNRLLNVRGDRTRLIATSIGNFGTPAYAALSHCWGKHKFLTTTSINLEEHINHIDVTCLPVTFQNAVFMCRKLGIDYIWIDSLCIIQDSASDWEVESALMCQYYDNAHITLETTSSASSAEPFLRSREQIEAVKDYSVRFVNDNQSTVYVRRCRNAEDGPAVQGPLLSRAWCFQEGVLSRRVVHFMDTGIIWECKQRLCDEDGLDPRWDREQVRLIAQVAEVQSNPHKFWFDCVEAYTKRDLTYGSDKLPALAGVAAKVQQYTKSTYVAGLWQDALVAGLCWTVNSTKPKPDYLPKEYRAPSWSWASLDAPVFFRSKCNFRSCPLLSIEDLEHETSGLNPFGQVRNSRLTVTGLVAQVRMLISEPNDPASYVTRRMECSYDKRTFVPIDAEGVQHRTWPIFTPDGWLSLTDDTLNPDGRDEVTRSLQPGRSFAAEVTCLHLGVGLSQGIATAQENDIDGFHHLILQETGPASGMFTRIGHMNCTVTEHDLTFVHGSLKTITLV